MIEVFLVTGFLTVVFVAFASLTPADLACIANWRFLRAALFLCIKPFLTALSIVLWALLRAWLFGLARNRLTASRKTRLVLLLRAVALLATRTRFLADLIIGINSLYLITTNLGLEYTEVITICKVEKEHIAVADNEVGVS